MTSSGVSFSDWTIYWREVNRSSATASSFGDIDHGLVMHRLPSVGDLILVLNIGYLIMLAVECSPHKQINCSLSIHAIHMAPLESFQDSYWSELQIHSV